MIRSIVAIGIVAGVAGAYAIGRVAAGYLENMQLPDALPVLGATAVISAATVVVALIPARTRGTRKPTRCE